MHRITALMMAAAVAVAPSWAMASTHVSVTGAVDTPLNLSAEQLQLLPAQTQAVSYGSGAGLQNHTYMGTSLWHVLNAAGVTVNPAVKNDVLNHYVLATGSDGYKVVLSLGELNPAFGNRPDLLAYAEQIGAQWQGLGADGPVRLTVPGDVKGGRYVSNLVNLDVRASGSTQVGTGGGVSGRFSVTGQVSKAASFDLAALQALPASSLTVGANTYTGVRLWDLLDGAVGLATVPGVKNDLLGMYVVATGSDGYKAVFSVGELSPGFGNQPDLIAYALNGETLADTGFARLVVPGDAKAGRYVSNLISIEVFRASPVPEPQAWALAMVGLAVLGAVLRAPRSVSGAAGH